MPHEGHIISVKLLSKSNIAKLTATYWKPGESEGDDVTMAFLVEVITGKLYIDEIGF